MHIPRHAERIVAQSDRAFKCAMTSARKTSQAGTSVSRSALADAPNS